MNHRQENFVDKQVTYTLELDGQFFLVENVPARMNEETGEQLFSPSTLESLQEIIISEQQPKQVIHTSVYSYSDSISFLSFIDQINEEIPEEDDFKLPRDFAKNLDHHLYGTPREES